MQHRSRTIRAILSAVVGAAAAALAVWLLRPEPRDLPEIRYRPWRLERPSTMPPLQVRPDRPLEFVERYRDMKLHLEAVLDENAELDVVFHWVQQWKPVGTRSLPPFHSRFSLLRLSTFRQGKPVLSQREALFGDGSGGVAVAAGRPATVLLETEGRRVRANVAGVTTGWIETTDDHGMVALVARGGNATIKTFEIDPHAIGDVLLSHGWAAILGAVMGLLLGVARRPRFWNGLVAVAFVVGGGLAGRWLLGREALLVGVSSTVPGDLVIGLCGVAGAVLVYLARGRLAFALAVVLGLIGVGVALEVGVRIERPRLRAFEDRHLDLYFGIESGPRPFDALAARVSRSGRISSWRAEGYDVLCLGSRQMFDADDPSKNLTRDIQGRLTSRLGRRVDCQTTATLTSNVLQQFLLLRDFYYDCRPKVVVLGLDAGETDRDLPLSAESLRQQIDEADSGSGAGSVLPFSALWDFCRRQGPGVPASTPREMQESLRKLHDYCRQEQIGLLLLVDDELPAEHRQAAAAFARQHDIGVIAGCDSWQMNYPASELAEKVAAILSASGR